MSLIGLIFIYSDYYTELALLKVGSNGNPANPLTDTWTFRGIFALVPYGDIMPDPIPYDAVIPKAGNPNIIRVATVPHGTPKWIIDDTLDDSDKSFTVPENKIWQLASIQARLTTSAIVGNRYIKNTITNAAGKILYTIGSGTAVAASQIGVYTATSGGSRSTTGTESGTNLSHSGELPLPCLLVGGDVIRVLDSSNIDATHDDLIVSIHYIEYDADLME